MYLTSSMKILWAVSQVSSGVSISSLPTELIGVILSHCKDSIRQYVSRWFFKQVAALLDWCLIRSLASDSTSRVCKAFNILSYQTIRSTECMELTFRHVCQLRAKLSNLQSLDNCDIFSKKEVHILTEGKRKIDYAPWESTIAAFEHEDAATIFFPKLKSVSFSSSPLDIRWDSPEVRLFHVFLRRVAPHLVHLRAPMPLLAAPAATGEPHPAITNPLPTLPNLTHLTVMVDNQRYPNLYTLRHLELACPNIRELSMCNSDGMPFFMEGLGERPRLSAFEHLEELHMALIDIEYNGGEDEDDNSDDFDNERAAHFQLRLRHILHYATTHPTLRMVCFDALSHEDEEFQEVASLLCDKVEQLRREHAPSSLIRLLLTAEFQLIGGYPTPMSNTAITSDDPAGVTWWLSQPEIQPAEWIARSLGCYIDEIFHQATWMRLLRHFTSDMVGQFITDYKQTKPAVFEDLVITVADLCYNGGQAMFDKIVELGWFERVPELFSDVIKRTPVDEALFRSCLFFLACLLAT
jgi:hypothetical protein